MVHQRLLLALLLFALSQAVQAEPVFQPDGLTAGDQYRLLFVTSEGTPATSTDIEFYNDFVQKAADDSVFGEWDLDWRAIISTAEVSAAENTETQREQGGVPIYRIDGELAVPSYRALWANELGDYEDVDDFPGLSWNLNENMFQNPLSNDGSNIGVFVWTGTRLDGTARIRPGDDSRFGDLSAGSANNLTGMGNARFDFGLNIMNGAENSLRDLPLYAMSEVITVVPEPSGSAFFAIGVLVALYSGRRERWAYSL